jgi:hypothetical protein
MRSAHESFLLLARTSGSLEKRHCGQVLKWLPKKGTVVFGAVAGPAAGGFHPKVLLWRTASGDRHCAVGSSNLSKAAFTSNYEANVSATLSDVAYARLAAWISEAADQSAAINEDWIGNHYREAKRSTGKPTSGGTSTTQAADRQALRAASQDASSSTGSTKSQGR